MKRFIHPKSQKSRKYGYNCLMVSYRALLVLLSVGSMNLLVPPSSLSQQAATANPATFDPLPALTATFPRSVTLSRANTLLEFCPDNTCDGFVASAGTSLSMLKDFAYLYEYFFSDYIYLPDWRKQPDARTMANRVLSKADYRNCKNDVPIEAARCVLLGIARKGSVSLTFVRYDEGARGVMPLDIVKELEKR